MRIMAKTGLGMAFAMMAFALPAAAQQGADAPVRVGVLDMAVQTVPQGFDLPGRGVAIDQVAIRPRVGGVVEQILYTPGQPVKPGDPLFRLDDAAYVAAAAADAATLATAEANLPVKQAAVERATRLVNQGTTRVDLETAQYELAAAQATLEAARAALDYARTELSWTTVRSPIEGVPEVQTVSVGDLVSAGQSAAMTTVTRLDPIYVDMVQSSARLLEFQSRIASGAVTPAASIAATLTLEDGEEFAATGRLISPSAMVSTSTGTIPVRFEFDNPDRRLLPGMFVRGFVTLGTVDAFLVPQRAATRAATGELTAFVVDADNKSKRVTLTEAGSYRNNWIVTAGIAPGDRLILDGLRGMRPGRAVDPVTATVDENGLVIDSGTN